MSERLTEATQGDPSLNGKPKVGAWPEPLGEDAYHGVTGAVVRRIDPQTEADPAAVLVQFLATFSAACGREPHFHVGATRHGARLFTLVVGQTSTARKGGSLDEAVEPIKAISGLKMTTGLSSGEGLIQEVRDPIYKLRQATRDERKRGLGDSDGMVNELVDPGVPDKRVLIEETEFGSVLSRMAREGNVLSPIIRDAWDGKSLRTMVRVSPLTATDPHVVICGHIVHEELQRKLGTADLFNGFSNRFLWICARRSKSIPRPGKPIQWAGSPEAKLIKDALMVSESEYDFSDEAGELWDSEYERLNIDRTGVLGAVTSRAAAQTRRLAMIYALLDLSALIELPHLKAALEVWRYCEDSARYLFGDSTGDPVADTILTALRAAGEKGMTRTEISGLLGRNQSSDRIDAALVVLVVRGVATRSEERVGNKPVERWRARP